jgi:hypothetical protein
MNLTEWANTVNGFTATDSDRMRNLTEREREALVAENDAHPANRRQSVVFRALDAGYDY